MNDKMNDKGRRKKINYGVEKKRKERVGRKTNSTKEIWKKRKKKERGEKEIWKKSQEREKEKSLQKSKKKIIK